jgi:hypothetical protein
MSATLKMGQSMNPRLMGPMKSTTPRLHRSRSMRFPRAPEKTSERARSLNRSPGFVFTSRKDRRVRATNVTGMKNQRGSLPMLSPKAAPLLKARVRGTSPPKSSMDRAARASIAHRFVAMSSIRMMGSVSPRMVVRVLTFTSFVQVSDGPGIPPDGPEEPQRAQKDGEKPGFSQFPWENAPAGNPALLPAWCPIPPPQAAFRAAVPTAASKGNTRPGLPAAGRVHRPRGRAPALESSPD